MILKKLMMGASIAALLASPLQAASPAASLSLSGAVRDGAALEGEGAIGGVAPLISIVVSLLGAYLAYEAFDFGGDEPPESA